MAIDIRCQCALSELPFHWSTGGGASEHEGSSRHIVIMPSEVEVVAFWNVSQ